MGKDGSTGEGRMWESVGRHERGGCRKGRVDIGGEDIGKDRSTGEEG